MRGAAAWHRWWSALALAHAAVQGSVGWGAGPSEREPAGVRAAPGWELFAGTNVPAFTLQLSPAAMDSLRRAPRQWVRGTLRFGGEVYPEVGVHIKGSEGSLQPIDRRPSLTVSFNRFAPSRRFFGLKKIHFNNTAEDPSFMTEIICSELARQCGLPAARAAHATLRLNERALGLYVVKEGLTKEFLAQYFRRPDGPLYEGGFQQDIDEPFECIAGQEPPGQPDRLALLAAARDPDLKRRWQRLQQVLDIDRFITLLAWTTITWNWDGYPMGRNNYRVYHDPETDRLVFFPHGLDQMFWEPRGSIYPPWRGLVAVAVMQVPEARQQYRQRLAALTEQCFKPGYWGARIDQLATLIAPHRPESATRAANLKQRIAMRAQSIATQLGNPELVSVRFEGGVAALTGWQWTSSSAQVRLDVLRTNQSRRLLRVQHPVVASTTGRLQVRVPAGNYQFAARLKVPELELAPADKAAGIRLRVTKPVSASSPAVAAASDWRELICPLAVPATGAEVELVCEVASARGQVWFDLDAFQLRRSTAGWGSRLLELLRW